ncbi:hypothetical protein [Nonomuraea sp. B19D2]|uniref:hypothetical protein n=1 Tax=Nonomuraea sp. B19D2 TaxID=3159561 RepID=UPI0032DA56C1
MRPPLYLTPPSTDPIRKHIRADRLGAITSPGQGNLLEEGWTFCIDNGCFGGSYPGDKEYLELLKKLRPLREWCLFAVAPDVPGNHFRTWERSRDMLPRIRDLGFPAAYAAQDLMDLDPWDIEDEYDVLFIAGTDEFKLSVAAANLAGYAIDLGKWVHMGRVNSFKRYQYAATIGCDSVDGTTLTRGPDRNLRDVLSWRKSIARQDSLFLPEVRDFFDHSYLSIPRQRLAPQPAAVEAVPFPQHALF